MKKILFVFLFLTLLAKTGVHAQDARFGGWLASFNTLPLKKPFSIHLDVQARSTDAWEQVQTMIVRPGINWHTKKAGIFTAGYAWIGNRRLLNGYSEILGEHRIWEQWTYFLPIRGTRLQIMNRLRLEQRFIPQAVAGGNGLEVDRRELSHRLRYFVRTVFPLTPRRHTESGKPAVFGKGFFLSLQDELFWTIGGQEYANGQGYDQNRLLAGIGYRLQPKIDVELGYLNQHIAGGNRRDIQFHIIQLGVYTRLN